MSTEVETAKKAYDDACAALRAWCRQNPGQEVTAPVELVDAIMAAHAAYIAAKREEEIEWEAQYAHR